jgi:hypothetical protein
MDIFVPYTGARFIKHEGQCYELAEVVSGPITHTIIDSTHESCEDCMGISSSCSSDCGDLPSVFLFSSDATDINFVVGTDNTDVLKWEWNDSSPVDETNNPSHLYVSTPNNINVVDEGNLEHFTGIVAAGMEITTIDLSNFINITTIIINNNSLNMLSIDNLLSTLVSHNKTGGILNIDNNAPPSVVGDAYIDILISRGWTVVV